MPSDTSPVMLTGSATRGRSDAASPERGKATGRRTLTPGRSSRQDGSPDRKGGSPSDGSARGGGLTNLVTDRSTMITSKTRLAAPAPSTAAGPSAQQVPVSAHRAASNAEVRPSVRMRTSPQNSSRSEWGAGAFAVPGKSHRNMPSRSKSSGARGAHRRTPSAPASLANLAHAHGTLMPRSGSSKTKQRVSDCWRVHSERSACESSKALFSHIPLLPVNMCRFLQKLPWLGIFFLAGPCQRHCAYGSSSFHALGLQPVGMCDEQSISYGITF